MITRAAAGRSARFSTRKKTLRLASLMIVAALFAAGFLVATPAYATSYPSWADVVAARHNKARAKAEVNRIKSLLAGLSSQLNTANDAALKAGVAATTAEQDYVLAADKQKTLQAQLATATAKAKTTEHQLGGYASQLARGPGGGGWSTLTLLINGDKEGELLNNLGAINQVSRADDNILQLALSEQNTVKQFTTLAAEQTRILAVQKKAADAARAAATAAAAKLQVAVTAEAAHQQALTVQLAALTTKLNLTKKQYDAGIRIHGGQPGIPDSQGWALPTVGVITSPWGYRYDPAQGYSWAFHYGDDIAHGCLQGIYAATSGTVVYAGIYSDIGNYIKIDNGNGIQTAYGHIAYGETFVRVGQHVSAGQNIARTGSTGFSTGCHLYFQVQVGGGFVDPVPFMRARGITLGVL